MVDLRAACFYALKEGLGVVRLHELACQPYCMLRYFNVELFHVRDDSGTFGVYLT